jgi:hypothetical protein
MRRRVYGLLGLFDDIPRRLVWVRRMRQVFTHAERRSMLWLDLHMIVVLRKRT